MEIQQCKVSPRFPLKLRLSLFYWENESGSGTEKGVMSGKRGLTLHCCISITEEVKINDLQKSIVTGLL